MNPNYLNYDNEYDQPPEYLPEFDDQMKRSVFIRRVFFFMTSGLTISLLFVVLSRVVDEIGSFLKAQSWLAFVFLAIFTIAYLLLICIDVCRRKTPYNVILFFLVVVSESVILAIITLHYQTDIIMFALIATFMLCFSIAVIAMCCPIDFTGFTVFYLIAGICLFACSLIVLIVSFFYKSAVLQVVYSFVVVFIIGMYFGYELQLIFGGKRFQMDTDEYILGAIVLYIDIVMICMHMLRILQYFLRG